MDDNIRKYNNMLIQTDLNSLMSLNRYLNSFSMFDKSILYLNFMRYNNFIVLEILDYLKKIYNIDLIENLKYKKVIKKIRAKLKCNLSVLSTSSEINEKMYKMFKKLNNPIIVKLFPNMCDNYGIYIYKNDVIANTFEAYIMMGKIFYKNNKPNKNKIISYSEEIGKLIGVLCDTFKVNKKIKCGNVRKNKNIRSKDYNLYKFTNDDTINVVIFLLNKLVSLNFYKLIISTQFNNKINSLNIKFKYILCRNTIEELKEINLDYNLYTIIFENIEFRNFMYHYAFPINFTNINNCKLLFGIPESLLNISERELNSILDKCISKLILNIKNEINSTKYAYIIKQ